MANPFSLNERPRSSALTDAAERLGRVASIVKDQQLARNQSGVRLPESEVYVASPEEAWSKKYMIQCVGPVCTVRPTDEGAALLLPRFQPEPRAEPKALAPERSIAMAAGASEAPPAPAPAVRVSAGKTQAQPI